MPAYAELQITSNFTFLEGASHPQELALTAAALGLSAFAVTDRNSLAGIVRAHLAAKEAGVRLVVGTRLDLQDGPSLLCYPTDRAAYGRLSQLLTVGKRRAPKGECWLTKEDVWAHSDGSLFAVIPPTPQPLSPQGGRGAFNPETLQEYRNHLGKRLSLALTHRYRGDDAQRIKELAEVTKIPLLATGDILYHHPSRKPLQDLLTCVRHHTTISQAGFLLEANAERHLKRPAEIARLFRHYPQALERSLEIAEACRFSLDELRYQYPDEVVPGGRSAQEQLEHLTWIGAAERYPEGVPERVRATLRHEFELIGQLGYAPYFLTVHDLVRFARAQGILCQGRGSAANSAVCYCLGITAVDPARVDLLFERFISSARNEPPDIDVDFEHQRREEVFQYIYAKYGRERAGLTATVTRYRARSAVRDVAKAMGLSPDLVNRLAKAASGWGRDALDPQRLREHGFTPEEPGLKLTLDLARDLIGFPRHLSQHVGGFVITQGPLSELCPILNAAMAQRTTIEWDKDDIDALGILKVDVLALGMLSCVRRAFALIARHGGPALTLATIPPEDPAVYAMLSRGDSLGVFQVESRAQMTMLPRLKPRTFYDLVIEVAIVRPGPIQGDMVHPYLRRRHGRETVEYPSPELRQVLEKTLGVPLFQEQAMKIAIVAAGFTPGEADQLRRAMATFKHTGTIHHFRDKMIGGMVARGYARDFAERCFRQIEGFGTYGFPESHAASFALLVYVSAWLKCHHPAAFAAALLNSQPMGFYAPAQIVRDAQEHGVTVLAPDVNRSGWESTLEPIDRPPPPLQRGRVGVGVVPLDTNFRQRERGDTPTPALPHSVGEGEKLSGRPLALRLGLALVQGLAEAEALKLVAARGDGYRSLQQLQRRGGLSLAALEHLADADAFGSLGLERRAALWEVKALGGEPLPLFAALETAEAEEPAAILPEMPLGEQVVADYASLTLSLKAHPVGLLRPRLAQQGMVPAAALASERPGRRLTVAGLVLVRQRPGTAKGVLFITLEDESGIANLIVAPPVFERWRPVILTSRLLAASGRLERQEGVTHLLVERVENLNPWLDRLSAAGPAADTFPDGRNFR